MTSDANIVREWIGGCLALHGFREDCPACVAHRDALAALDRLEAERDEPLAANEAAKQFSYASHRQRAEAAEAENVQLLKRLAFFTDGDQTITVGRKFLKDLEWAATAAEARVTELEAALTVYVEVAAARAAIEALEQIELGKLTNPGWNAGTK